MKLDYFDLLSDVPIAVKGIGHVKSPKLRDIRKIGMNTYNMYLQMISLDFQQFLKTLELDEIYDRLTEDEKKQYGYFQLVTYQQDFLKMYFRIFNFFLEEKVTFDGESQTFKTWTVSNREGEEEQQAGAINAENFEQIKSIIAQINYIESTEEKAVKYKNDRARALAEKIEQAKARQVKPDSKKEESGLANMISKYCADNKSGMTLLNVWELTIYQFYDQFSQHNYIRQIDLQDRIYANSVSMKEISSYDTQSWLKLIKT